MKKTLTGSIILTCLYMSSLAQTPEPLAAYKAAVQSHENFNRVQREAGMPEMAVPTIKEWLKAEEEKATAPAVPSIRDSQREKAIREKQRLLTTKLEEGRRNAQRTLTTKTFRPRIAKAKREQALTTTGVRKLSKQWSEYRRVANAPMDQELREILSPENGLLPVASRNGLLEILGTDNFTAADTISLDELWPGGNSLLPDVTGEGRLVGVWEAGGGVLASHDEFQSFGSSRVAQIDDPTISQLPSAHNHATQVAGTITAAGLQANARGGAYGTEILAYDSVGDIGEMTLAVAAGLELSNHSYSSRSGWIYNSTYGWIWIGRDVVGEDPTFGIYTYQAREIDLLCYDSETYLPLFSSGNEVTEPGPVNLSGVIPAGTLYYRAVDSDGDGIIDQLVVDDTTHPSDAGIPLSGATPPYQGWPAIGPGFDTCKPRACAKNTLAVGAIDDVIGGIQNSSDAQIAPFSSRGPTDDGRIKPDIVANGVDVVTTDYDSSQGSLTDRYTDGVNGATPVSGTSFSTPSASGMLAGIQELHESLGGEPLWASSLKAITLGTADDAVDLPDFTGLGTVSFTGPDYFYGWGVANAERAAALVYANDTSISRRTHLRQHVLFDGNTIQIPVEWDGTSSEIRVTLVWTDPAFQDVAIASGEEGVPELDDNTVADDPTLRLINDLDIRVTTPGSTTLEPWVLDPANPELPATTGDNFRDNVEQVVIENPVAGTFTVTVSHKNNLKAAFMLEPGHPQYAPNETRYELSAGQYQNFSLAIEGNKEIETDEFAITMIEPMAGDALLEWKSIPGVRYQVETTSDLTVPDWTAAEGSLDAISLQTPLTISGALGNTTGFYRVLEVMP